MAFDETFQVIALLFIRAAYPYTLDALQTIAWFSKLKLDRIVRQRAYTRPHVHTGCLFGGSDRRRLHCFRDPRPHPQPTATDRH